MIVNKGYILNGIENTTIAVTDLVRLVQQARRWEEVVPECQKLLE